VPLLPPLFFLSVTPLFYLVLYILDIPTSSASDSGFFFPSTSDSSSSVELNTDFNDGGVSPLSFSSLFFPSYSLLKNSNPFLLINMNAILHTLPTQLGCVIFSLMHVPINIPSMR